MWNGSVEGWEPRYSLLVLEEKGTRKVSRIAGIEKWRRGDGEGEPMKA